MCNERIYIHINFFVVLFDSYRGSVTHTDTHSLSHTHAGGKWSWSRRKKKRRSFARTAASLYCELLHIYYYYYYIVLTKREKREKMVNHTHEIWSTFDIRMLRCLMACSSLFFLSLLLGSSPSRRPRFAFGFCVRAWLNAEAQLVPPHLFPMLARSADAFSMQLLTAAHFERTHTQGTRWNCEREIDGNNLLIVSLDYLLTKIFINKINASTQRHFVYISLRIVSILSVRTALCARADCAHKE